MLAFKTNVQVLGRLAESFIENNSLKKTEMHLVSRLRWDSFVKYLDWMQKNGFIESQIDGRVRTYMLTPSGREMFNRLLDFVGCIQSTKLAKMV